MVNCKISLSTNTTYRVYNEKIGGTHPSQFIGNAGDVFWRTASETGIRIKSSGGTSLVTAASGSANSANFSSNIPRFGPATNPFGSTMTRQYRIYSGGIENLAISGRSPVTVLDADWVRVQTRITASGNTIFV